MAPGSASLVFALLPLLDCIMYLKTRLLFAAFLRPTNDPIMQAGKESRPPDVDFGDGGGAQFTGN